MLEAWFNSIKYKNRNKFVQNNIDGYFPSINQIINQDSFVCEEQLKTKYG